ncbi:TIGR03862 family flavoprotein [Comamonas sp. 17RB]|uniref:NAD(P)/FAD-dependent oxidoreductase n=1 Tax=Comamonas sp. 17RB TaxID=3047025 RepID=UPI0024B6F30E|nr:TIGR03862 family flavoprotein [Comamonas sp. 17RB]MDI9854975.1 TIGR03862 family flavoprotein [Comamonas sp. 17RB]
MTLSASSQDALHAGPAALDCEIAIIGAGPAGLMAAERLSAQGRAVCVFDAKASVGRKFLLAGKGGMNLTHSEPLEAFVGRYGDSAAHLRPLLEAFGPQQVCEWVQGLGLQTFVGSSGRVFPTDMKAAPLLRAWMTRLRQQGVRFFMRHRWTGWASDGSLQLQAESGRVAVRAQAVLLALGGGSWARLGSDGAWVPWLAERQIAVAPLQPSNCGFDVGPAPSAEGETRRAFLQGLVGQPADQGGWTPWFKERFAGQPFKSVAIRFVGSDGRVFDRRGEFVATETGVEGSLVYAVSSQLRDEIQRSGSAVFHLDLLPAWSDAKVLSEVRHPRGSRSLSSHLKGRLGLDGIKAGILREVLSKAEMEDPVRLAAAIKALPITVVAPRPIDEVISTAGGVRWDAVDADLMSRQHPGLFFAGEMLDWEAPTGGYLLTACMATGVQAAQGMNRFLASRAAAA